MVQYLAVGWFSASMPAGDVIRLSPTSGTLVRRHGAR